MPHTFWLARHHPWIVGQDGILRAGWQPALVGLFTSDPGGSPTRRRLKTTPVQFCQLASAKSLREICQGLAASEGKLRRLGVPEAPVSAPQTTQARQIADGFPFCLTRPALARSRSPAASRSAISCRSSCAPYFRYQAGIALPAATRASSASPPFSFRAPASDGSPRQAGWGRGPCLCRSG
jgi:Domain of unknown function (DUF4372)